MEQDIVLCKLCRYNDNPDTRIVIQTVDDGVIFSVLWCLYRFTMFIIIMVNWLRIAKQGQG